MSKEKSALELLQEYKKNHKESSGGYWRIVEADQLLDLVTRLTGKQEDTLIPFAISVFGEILVLTKEKYVTFIDCPSSTTDVIASGLQFFFDDLETESYMNEHFRMRLFVEAKEKYGLPKPDQCYAFVPMLALGGTESVNNLDLCDWSVHLELLL